MIKELPKQSIDGKYYQMDNFEIKLSKYNVSNGLSMLSTILLFEDNDLLGEVVLNKIGIINNTEQFQFKIEADDFVSLIDRNSKLGYSYNDNSGTILITLRRNFNDVFSINGTEPTGLTDIQEAYLIIFCLGIKLRRYYNKLKGGAVSSVIVPDTQFNKQMRKLEYELNNDIINLSSFIMINNDYCSKLQLDYLGKELYLKNVKDIIKENKELDGYKVSVEKFLLHIRNTFRFSFNISNEKALNEIMRVCELSVPKFYKVDERAIWIDYIMNECEWDGTFTELNKFLYEYRHDTNEIYKEAYPNHQYAMIYWLCQFMFDIKKTDKFLLLIGTEGNGKSLFFKSLLPDYFKNKNAKVFTEYGKSLDTLQNKVMFVNNLLMYFEETDKSYFVTNAEDIKSITTNDKVEIRYLYKNEISIFNRSCIFGGTTNNFNMNLEVQKNGEGGRRYIPFVLHDEDSNGRGLSDKTIQNRLNIDKHRLFVEIASIVKGNDYNGLYLNQIMDKCYNFMVEINKAVNPIKETNFDVILDNVFDEIDCGKANALSIKNVLYAKVSETSTLEDLFKRTNKRDLYDALRKYFEDLGVKSYNVGGRRADRYSLGYALVLRKEFLNYQGVCKDIYLNEFNNH